MKKISLLIPHIAQILAITSSNPNFISEGHCDKFIENCNMYLERYSDDLTQAKGLILDEIGENAGHDNIEPAFKMILEVLN